MPPAPCTLQHPAALYCSSALYCDSTLYCSSTLFHSTLQHAAAPCTLQHPATLYSRILYCREAAPYTTAPCSIRLHPTSCTLQPTAPGNSIQRHPMLRQKPIQHQGAPYIAGLVLDSTGTEN